MGQAARKRKQRDAAASAKQADFHPPPLPTHPRLWRIRRKDIAAAIKFAKKRSAPGPDGLPYAVWQHLGELGVDILWDVATALAGSQASALIDAAYWDQPDSYNASLLVCLPKKPAGQLPEGIDYYTAEATRPLALVNTDNRLVAAAAKRRWERTLGAWVYQHQRGFIPGRSIL